jgi:DNA-binding IclR family transcriptional regulator
MEGAVMSNAQPGNGGSADQNDIQAVTRAGQILALFSPTTPELSPAEVADRLGLNRTTAYRYCTSLVSAGLLERGVENGRFIPSGLLLQLGSFALGRRRVVNLAPPYLQSLSRDSQMAAVLSLWGAGGPVVTRVEEDTATIVVVSVRVGSQLPLDTAQCRVFLAFHQDQLAVARLTGNLGNGQRERLLAELERIRATGHCSMSSTPGVVAVAAPVFDEYGICATVAVVGTDNALSEADDAPELQLVIRTARELTKEMGGRYLPDEA